MSQITFMFYIVSFLWNYIIYNT